MAESEEELKSFLTMVKEESEKAVLKLNIHSILIHHFIPTMLLLLLSHFSHV